MTEVVGIRFKRTGPIYHFDPSSIELEVGDNVVVDTTHGSAIGKVITTSRDIAQGEVSEPLKPVVRKAEQEDLEQAEIMTSRGKVALAKCGELVERFHLPMKLLAAEYNLDGSHLTVFFKSEKRVDFRSLLRELSASEKTRVELRQVGARDAAKLVGGVGMCGRPLCCSSHLCKFEPISMKMAREQNLPLNPANISGVCGRLLCCLSYENQQYRAMKQRLPAHGRTVTTPQGKARVLAGNAIKETVVVQLENDAIVELPLSDVEPMSDNSSQ
jgi:cell fate regulator YaaT (PSP1 superfamily)